MVWSGQVLPAVLGEKLSLLAAETFFFQGKSQLGRDNPELDHGRGRGLTPLPHTAVPILGVPWVTWYLLNKKQAHCTQSHTKTCPVWTSDCFESLWSMFLLISMGSAAILKKIHLISNTEAIWTRAYKSRLQQVVCRLFLMPCAFSELLSFTQEMEPPVSSLGRNRQQYTCFCKLAKTPSRVIPGLGVRQHSRPLESLQVSFSICYYLTELIFVRRLSAFNGLLFIILRY